MTAPVGPSFSTEAYVGRSSFAIRMPPVPDNEIGTDSTGRGFGGYRNDPRHGGERARADGGFCRGIGAGPVPWPDGHPRHASKSYPAIAGQGDERVAARSAHAHQAEENAEALTGPRADFQGRGRARGLEAGQHGPLPVAQDLSDLPVVGRYRAEGA